MNAPILIAVLLLWAQEPPAPLSPRSSTDALDGGAAEFSLGPAAGYLRARGADEGTWFGGLQARLRLAPILSVEGSVTFHENDYSDGDIRVTQYPVQVTGLVTPFPLGSVRPYALAGAGWYYTRTRYSGLPAVL